MNVRKPTAAARRLPAACASEFAARRRMRPWAAASNVLTGTGRPCVAEAERLRGLAQRCGHRADEDLHIEPERPVLDVVGVPFDAVGERRLPAQPVDLGPAGDPGLHAVALSVTVDPALEPPRVVSA